MTNERNERSLRIIAKEIREDWRKVSMYAEPYLEAMETLESIRDQYYMDSAESVVLYFLSNASGWRGQKAREIKAELKRMLNDLNH